MTHDNWLARNERLVVAAFSTGIAGGAIWLFSLQVESFYLQRDVEGYRSEISKLEREIATLKSRGGARTEDIAAILQRDYAVELRGAQGKRGPQGERGLKGDKGEDGDSPTAAEVADTLMARYAAKLRGPTGPTGPTGPRGPKGEKGLIELESLTSGDIRSVLKGMLLDGSIDLRKLVAATLPADVRRSACAPFGIGRYRISGRAVFCDSNRTTLLTIDTVRLSGRCGIRDKVVIVVPTSKHEHFKLKETITTQIKDKSYIFFYEHARFNAKSDECEATISIRAADE